MLSDIKIEKSWPQVSTPQSYKLLSFIVLFCFNGKLSEQNLKQHICKPQERCACREILFPMQSSTWKLLIASSTTHHVDTERDGFLSDSALEQRQMIGDTFSLGMFADTGETAPLSHPDSGRYCRWTRGVQSFMSICPSPPKWQSVGKIPRVGLTWPRKLFWPPYAPSKLEEGITKQPVEWI